MKKAFISLMLTLAIAISCLPFTSFTAKGEYIPLMEDDTETSVDMIVDSGSSFYIVPDHASSYAVSIDASNLSVISSMSSGKANAWYVRQNGDYVYFEDSVSGKVLELADGAAARRVRLRLVNYTGADTQLWRLDPKGKGFVIRPKVDPLYALDNSGAKSVENNPISLWNGSDHQFNFVLKTPGIKKFAADASKSCFICPQAAEGSALEINAQGSA